MISGQKTQTEDILEQTRRILTESAAPSPPEESSPCCSTEEEEVCCEPAEKSSCCGPEATADGGCGCQ